MAVLKKISCRHITGPSFSRPTALCFACFSSNHTTGKRYPEMDMDRTEQILFQTGNLLRIINIVYNVEEVMKYDFRCGKN